jgi:hypothetical protein
MALNKIKQWRRRRNMYRVAMHYDRTADACDRTIELAGTTLPTHHPLRPQVIGDTSNASITCRAMADRYRKAARQL